MHMPPTEHPGIAEEIKVHQHPLHTITQRDRPEQMQKEKVQSTIETLEWPCTQVVL